MGPEQGMTRVRPWLRYVGIIGNVVYFLWIVRYGINEGFHGSLVEVVSVIGLLVLLFFNVALLSTRGT